jgi:hypothetical protein
MYMPAQLKDSKKISAVASRFSGGFNGCLGQLMGFLFDILWAGAHRLGKQEEVVLWFDTEIFEDRVGPESFHVILEKRQLRCDAK